MTKTVEFEGQQHDFPDDATDEEIRKALSGGENKPPMLSEAVAGAQSEAAEEIPAVMSKINEDSIASALGLPVDAASAALRFVTGGYIDPGHGEPFLGSNWLRDLMRTTGASKSKQQTLSGQVTGDTGSVEPKTMLGKGVAAVGGGAIESAMTGGGAGALIKKAGERFAAPALEKTGEVMSRLRGNVAAGAGGGAGGEVGRQATKGTPLEPAGTVVGQLIGGAVGGVAEPAARLRPSPPVAVPDPVLSSYERLKLAPSAAERSSPTGITGSAVRWLQGNILPQTIGGGGVIENFRVKRMQDLTRIQQDLASSYGQVESREGMGGEIKKNVLDTWTQAKEKDGEIIGGLRQKYGPSVLNANELISATQRPIGAGTIPEVTEATMDPLMKEAIKIVEASGGRMTFNDLMGLKTKYGGAMEPGFQKNVNDAQVSQLWNAVRSDMENYIRQVSPDDYTALKRANARYADAQKNFSAHFKKLVGTGDVPVSGERAYDIIRAAITEKGRADLQEFRQVWDTLSPQVRGNLAATVLGRMGVTSHADVGNWQTWQLGRFLSEYRNLAPEAKQMLFGGKKDVAAALDDLATVTANMQDRMLKLASSSRSGTGALVLGQFGLGGIISHFAHGGWDMVKSALWGVGGPWVASHMLTNPTLVRSTAAALRKVGDGVDGAGRAAMTLSGLPRVGQKAIIPQQIVDESKSEQAPQNVPAEQMGGP